MSRELRIIDVTGLSVTAKVINSATSSNSTVSLTESFAGYYLADFPSVAAGTYDVSYSDGTNLIGAETIVWDGSAVVSFQSELDAIQAKTNLINATGIKVTIVNPVSSTGELKLQRGDDYKAADSRAVAMSFVGVPNLTDGTVAFDAVSTNGRFLAIAPIIGAVTSPATNPTVSFDIPKAATTCLKAGVAMYEYAVVATLANGDVVTLQTGDLTVKE